MVLLFVQGSTYNTHVLLVSCVMLAIPLALSYHCDTHTSLTCKNLSVFLCLPCCVLIGKAHRRLSDDKRQKKKERRKERNKAQRTTKFLPISTSLSPPPPPLSLSLSLSLSLTYTPAHDVLEHNYVNRWDVRKTIRGP